MLFPALAFWFWSTVTIRPRLSTSNFSRWGEPRSSFSKTCSTPSLPITSLTV